ncbi:hypothetical protein [Agrobacterium burrii]|uniref:Uncharacterized protein n=1 Tax=Agrobacterium burrii TaxID=2815339 RepID=A0ABS3EQU5_9HYPH|nr:hypothetical protein [Agrobacterium burrii]MBO0134289.1 hypothetical protein [Agrobacterium burrii]
MSDSGDETADLREGFLTFSSSGFIPAIHDKIGDAGRREARCRPCSGMADRVFDIAENGTRELAQMQEMR